MNRLEEIKERVIALIDEEEELGEDALIEIIARAVSEASGSRFIPYPQRVRYGIEVFNSLRRYDVLQELIENDDITEIMVNGAESIFIEMEGTLYPWARRFSSKKKLEDVIQQIVSSVNRTANERTPIADARLEDGSRVNVVLGPVALNGPIVTIRKFPKHPITMEELVRRESIDEDSAEFLKKMVRAKYNIFISGGTGSGKTTFLNALSEFIPEEERIITIEDNAELQLRHLPNLVRLEARQDNMEGTGAIPIRDLIKTALRMRPDRIIVGEVRAGEALDMLQAMNTGHDGSLSTGHANSPRDMISRLETMVLGAADLPLAAIDRQIGSAVDLIIHLGRLRDKSRRVIEIVEVMGSGQAEVKMRTLRRFVETGEKDGRICGKLEKENPLLSREKLLAAGGDSQGD